MTVDPQAPARAQQSIRVRRTSAAVVGRSVEIDALQAGLERARGGVFAVTFEGEPGIGKSHLLLAGAELAAAAGFAPVDVTADEEIRGPFLLARGMFAGPTLRDGLTAPAQEAVQRAHDALAGRDAEVSALPPDQRMLRTMDQAALAIRAVALERPLAFLLDDVQWADTDSLRLLRYVVRTEPGLPILIVLAMRSEEAVLVTELVNLLADLERMGLVRRMRVGRFRQSESAELLRQSLGGPVDAPSAATLHAQSEGVPFVVEELLRSYREAGLLQRIDGAWRLDPKASRLLPSAVRTLVQRRAAHLDDDVKAVLSEASVLGRSFRLSDLCAVRTRLGTSGCTPSALGETLRPAVTAGLLQEAAEGSGADFRFSHEQVREFAMGLLTAPRRRATHAAIVDMLTSDGDPPASVLPVLARHALAAGDTERSARFSVDAVAAALAANAPEEALRLVEEVLPIVSTRAERVALLRARDDAYDMLCRPADRLEGLSELAALAEAANDQSLVLEVALRRAAALRLDEQYERAAGFAADVRRRAREAGDARHELAACLELGQDLLRVAIGEGYTPVIPEADLAAAADAYGNAAGIAERLGDDRSLAAASRELGIISYARLRGWFAERAQDGALAAVAGRIAAGETLMDMLPEFPIAPLFMETSGYLQRALELYERVGDRRGAMSAIIALAYLTGGADVHFGTTPAQRIEEIRRLAGQMRSMSRESERSSAEAQMLYGVHVFARAKVIPDLAVSRGADAHEQARATGDRAIEFLAAGGTAMAYLDVGLTAEAGQWLDRSATAAAAAPTPLRARRLEAWRGLAAGAVGDRVAMRDHLERAVDLAKGQGRRAALAEATAMLALEAARLGAKDSDQELLDLAETAANEAGRLAGDQPGHPLWGAQAVAARARVALARGDQDRAVEHARAAIDARRTAMREDPHLEVLLPAARAILAGGTSEEQQAVRGELQLLRSFIVQRTIDEEMRVAWFRGPIGSELSELAGQFDPAAAAGLSAAADDRDRTMLGLLTEGRSNAQIAAALELGEEDVARRLAVMYARLGVSSRSEATALALRGRTDR
jgi:DNA-binding NarL/FixJ family response regulator